jgi:hypothetical protein
VFLWGGTLKLTCKKHYANVSFFYFCGFWFFQKILLTVG